MRDSCIKAIATIILIITLGGCGVKPMDSQENDSINTYDTAVRVIETPDAKMVKNESREVSSNISEDSASKKENYVESVCSDNDIEVIEYNIELYESTNEEDDIVGNTFSVTEETASTDIQIAEDTDKEDTDNDVDKISEEQQSTPECSASDLQSSGVIYWGGWRWTWYSQNVLPGGGLSIPGRHIDESGYVCDENDYICLAATSLSQGTVVDTPFGKQGKVYDSGCAYGTLDVYTAF